MSTAVVRSQIVKRLTPKYVTALDWSMLVQAVQDATSAERNQIVEALRKSDTKRAGSILRSLVRRRAGVLAGNEADSILSDDSLSIDEVIRIYGRS